MKTYYALEIIDNTVPKLHGPYTSWQYRDDMALLLRASDPEKKHGLYSICLATTDAPFTDSLKIDVFGAPILDPLQQNICDNPCTLCTGTGMADAAGLIECPRCDGSGIEPKTPE